MPHSLSSKSKKIKKTPSTSINLKPHKMRQGAKHAGVRWQGGRRFQPGRRGKPIHFEPERVTRPNVSSTGRAVDDTKHFAPIPDQPKDRSYKTGTYRLHWKGHASTRKGTRYTSGITPFSTTRHQRSWSKAHKARAQELGQSLQSGPMFHNPFGQHGAENSHLIAGSLYGPNDELSAPPASIHQNTEWLAIEEGIKDLAKRRQSALGGEMRIKATGYVHDQGQHRGTLKASRYKIYFGGRKVFDHVAHGQRGNIGKDEARQLRDHVKGLKKTSPAVSLHGGSKGVYGSTPTQQEARRGHGSSPQSSMFTDLKANDGRRLSGARALQHAQTKMQRS